MKKCPKIPDVLLTRAETFGVNPTFDWAVEECKYYYEFVYAQYDARDLKGLFPAEERRQVTRFYNKYCR